MTNPAAKSIQVFMLMLLGMVLAALLFIVIGFLPLAPTAVLEQQTVSLVNDCGSTEHKGDFYKAGLEGNFVHGEKLFLEHCASCHKADMKGDLTGPALGYVYGRWGNDTSKLFAFIRNSQDYLANNEDKYAQELFEAYQRTVMAPFPSLTNQDLIDIMFFIEY